MSKLSKVGGFTFLGPVEASPCQTGHNKPLTFTNPNNLPPDPTADRFKNAGSSKNQVPRK